MYPSLVSTKVVCGVEREELFFPYRFSLSCLHKFCMLRHVQGIIANFPWNTFCRADKIGFASSEPRSEGGRWLYSAAPGTFHLLQLFNKKRLPKNDALRTNECCSRDVVVVVLSGTPRTNFLFTRCSVCARSHAPRKIIIIRLPLFWRTRIDRRHNGDAAGPLRALWRYSAGCGRECPREIAIFCVIPCTYTSLSEQSRIRDKDL